MACSNLIAVGFWRRVGDSVEVRISTQTSNCTAGFLNWSLPASLAYDAAKVTDYNPVLGSAEVLTSANAVTTGVVLGQRGARTTVSAAVTAGSGGIICATAGTGGVIRMHFSAPIVGWSVAN